MPLLEYFFVCHGFSIDQSSNRLSVHEFLEEVRPRKFPAAITKMIFISTWISNKDEQQKSWDVVIRMKTPGLVTQEFPMKLLNNGSFFRLLQGVFQIPLVQAGVMELELLLEDKPVAHHRILIRDANEQHVDAVLLGGGNEDIEIENDLKVNKEEQ